MLNYVNSCPRNHSYLIKIHQRKKWYKKKIINRRHVTNVSGTTERNDQFLFASPKISRFRTSHLSFTRRRNFEWPIATKKRRKKEREVGTYRGGRVKRVLPTRDQHRREIASNLWVRLITGECSSFDSPLFLRPQLHQTSFQRRGEPPLLSHYLFRSLSLSSKFVPPPSRLPLRAFIRLNLHINSAVSD